MRSLNYIRNQIEFAAKGNGKITVNQNLVDAFNDVAEFINTSEQNTNIEDSLILFYILQMFSIDNIDNKLAITSKNVEISNPHTSISRLFTMVRPKENVIDGIYIELKGYQILRRVPEENCITRKEVKELISKLLSDVKNFREFEMLKTKKYVYR